MPMELEDGRSSWPEKNSLEDIAMIKRSMSDAAYQTEYRCNPVRLGAYSHKSPGARCHPFPASNSL